MEEIIKRTDGVPLFIEELTKAVVEAQASRESGEDASATTSRSALAVPATLHASLMARLDRLGPGPKKMAQIGAAIGREFSYELLAAVAGPSEREIQDRLARLVHSELVFQRGAPPESVYSFKHALVQDAAYSTLLRSDRQRLHARIAEAVEGRFPGPRGARARTAGAPLYGSLPNRTCRRLLAEGRRTRCPTFGQSGSHPASHPRVRGAEHATGKFRAGSAGARFSDRDRHAHDRRTRLFRATDRRRLQPCTRAVRASRRGRASRRDPQR